MQKKTRLIKSKIAVVPPNSLAPAPFPLATTTAGRRRAPVQERALRTRSQILAAGLGLATELGPGAVTMQLVAKRSKIAAGTAYQFFTDRDAIYYEIYEQWASEYWARLMLATSIPLNLQNWEEGLRSTIESTYRFHHEQLRFWPIVRYVESTPAGMRAARKIFVAFHARSLNWIGPLFRAVGYSPAETDRICKTVLRISRGHSAVTPITKVDLLDLIESSFDAQQKYIASCLSEAPRSGSRATVARRSSGRSSVRQS